MKKILCILFFVVFIVGLSGSSFAVQNTVQSDVYVTPNGEITTMPNDTIPLAPAEVPGSAPGLPATGGIPLWAFTGTGILLIATALVISTKKPKPAK